MRAIKVLSAAVIVAMLIAVPFLTASADSDAAVDEKSSAVYFKSNENISAETIAKYIDLDISSDTVEKALISTGGFNTSTTDGFKVSDVKTSNYTFEIGVANKISGSSYSKDSYSVLKLDLEFNMKNQSDNAKLFSDDFNGDVRYGFEKSVEVRTGDSISFKGTMKIILLNTVEKSTTVSDGKYIVKEDTSVIMEETKLDLNAVYRTSDGKELTYRFKSCFSGWSSESDKLDLDSFNVSKVAFGDICVTDTDILSYGKGSITMTYQSKDYSAVSDQNCCKGLEKEYKTNCYSGKMTSSFTNEELMTESEYKGLYSNIALRSVFTEFSGSEQELKECLASIGTVAVDDYGKVEDRGEEIVLDFLGSDDNLDLIVKIAVITAAVILIVLIIIVVVLVIHKRRNRRY